jgi:hypothetical protein
VTMLSHAVIATSLPAGLNTGPLAQGISARSREVTTRRCRTQSAAQERRFLQALVPDGEEPPDAPRFQFTRVAPIPSGGTSLVARPHDRLFRSLVTALCLVAAGGTMSALFSINPQEVFITAIRFIVYCNLPVPISPQGVRRAPHERQQVILCTWPLSFGNLASASWQ